MPHHSLAYLTFLAKKRQSSLTNGDVKTEEEGAKRRRVDGMEGDKLQTRLGESEADIRHLLDSFKLNPDGTFSRIETESGGVEESSIFQDTASELLSQSLNSEQLHQYFCLS